MSVFGIVSEIMEDEEFEEEETNNKNYRRNEDVSRDVDVVDTVDNTSTDDTSPKSLNTFDACIIFPSKCFLSEREISRIIDESEEGKATSSVERHTDHTKECMWEVPKDRAKYGIIGNSLHIATVVGYVDHVFDIFCECKTDSHESYAIDIVCDALGTYRRAEEVP